MKNEVDGGHVTHSVRDKLRRAIENTPYNGDLADVPSFGIWNPSIKEAAELLVVDMWFSGDIEGVDEPEDFDGSACSPKLKEALAEQITAFEGRLSSAVDSGRLKASRIRRDLDDQLISDETHVGYDELVAWMDEKGLEGGDHLSAWTDAEVTIAALICDEVAFLRGAHSRKELTQIEKLRRNAQSGMLDDAQELVEVQAALKAKIAEVHRLRAQLAPSASGLPANVDRPLHTKQRRTLLTIIAALCSKARIDCDARGAAQRIKSAVELLGASIDDGTIDTVLKEIPDALEARIK
jgi:hypothetical protein